MPLMIGGGAGVLGHPEQLPKEFKFLRERSELYREVFPSLQRVVLINHEDCRVLRIPEKKLLGFLARVSSSHPSMRAMTFLWSRGPLSICFRIWDLQWSFTMRRFVDPAAPYRHRELSLNRSNASDGTLITRPENPLEF